MNDTLGDPHDELLKGIVQEAPSESVIKPKVAKSQFEPWHKPRKQWARLVQWADRFQSLIKAVNHNQERQRETFRYLSLPGNDLFDVREIRTICERENVELYYTGFNSLQHRSAQDLALNETENEIRGLPNIDRRSLVHRHRLEAIAESSSVSLRK